MMPTIKKLGCSLQQETQKGSLCPSIGLKNRQNLNSEEAIVVTKLNHISEYIKDLEGNLVRVRKNLQRKATIEGRENDKICAVQGTIVCNPKSYYQNLESNINSLLASFQDQFKKILQEFESLQALSRTKSQNTSAAFFNELSPRSSKLPEFPTLRVLKNYEMKSVDKKVRAISFKPYLITAEPISSSKSSSAQKSKSAEILPKSQKMFEPGSRSESPNEILGLDDCLLESSDQEDSENEEEEDSNWQNEKNQRFQF